MNVEDVVKFGWYKMTNIENEESLIGKRFGILTVVEINYIMKLRKL